VLNDTVGCLMSCAFHDTKTRIGVIIGTGTNACYVEKMAVIEKFDKSSGPAPTDEMIINIEWGAFGDDGCLDFLRTQVDKDIDAVSLNEGRQTFEKMISGMYLGEVVRRLMLTCIERGLLFNGRKTRLLETENSFLTKYLSEIEDEEVSSSSDITRPILEKLGVRKPTEDDCKHVHNICSTVTTRAANLAGAGIACLINRIGLPQVTVAVDGSLFRFHPHFKQHMIQMTNQLIKSGLSMSMMLSEDGSGKGAALVAAVANRVSAAKKGIDYVPPVASCEITPIAGPGGEADPAAEDA